MTLLFRFINTKITNSNDSLLYEQEFSINELVHVGQLKLSLTSSLPTNSIFFQSDYGYFVTKNFCQKVNIYI